mgnify:CR=1 FL=1
MFAEASVPQQDGDKARLVSPTYRSSLNGKCLRYGDVRHLLIGQLSLFNLFTLSF